MSGNKRRRKGRKKRRKQYQQQQISLMQVYCQHRTHEEPSPCGCRSCWKGQAAVPTDVCDIVGLSLAWGKNLCSWQLCLVDFKPCQPACVPAPNRNSSVPVLLRWCLKSPGLLVHHTQSSSCMLVLHGEAGGRAAVTATVLACSKHRKLSGKKLHSGDSIKLISCSLAHIHRRPVSVHLNSTDWD